MLKSLIAAILSFVFGVALTKYLDDKQIIDIHRTYSRAIDTERSDTFAAAWKAGYEYALERHGITEN